MRDPVVIIGTGLAGYNLAKEFRKLDLETPLLLITADDGRVYSKPLLSTAFGKKQTADALASAEPGAMAEQLNAEIRTHTRVSGIDPGHRRLWIGEEAVYYRDLVLACGAEAVQVPITGDSAAVAKVFSVNDLQDYARFRAAVAENQRVLILGVGLIGCEFANDLRLGGVDVDLVAPCEQVMPTLVPAPIASAIQAGLESLGARFHLGQVLNRLESAPAESDSVERLQAHLSDGTVVVCDAVLSAIGLRPRLQLATAAGLQTNRGIVVDRTLRTSHANIYALGDCAEVDGLNLLYVMPLMTCARALAKTLAGLSTATANAPGQMTAVSYPAMPVLVKTPVCPLVVATPPLGQRGTWQVEGSGGDLRALCRATDGTLLGYALTGSCVSEKLALNRQLPALLA